MRRFVLLTLSLALFRTVLALAQAPASTAAPKGNAESGKKIFDGYGCYQCHNYAANGGSAGPRLAPNPMAWSAFSQYVRAPRDQMPPFSRKVLSDQELRDVYAYLQTIPPPAAGSISILKR
jgi:ubiquinol-cytochrome c reductase cytochrome c subunit